MKYQYLEIAVINHIIDHCKISSEPINTYDQITTMVNELYDKYKGNSFYIEESLGMSKKDILNCEFNNEKFKKLLDLYLKERRN